MTKTKEVFVYSIGTGSVYIVFSTAGITLFPREQIRDIGDIVMPYITALSFGCLAIIVYLVLGFTLKWIKKQ